MNEVVWWVSIVAAGYLVLNAAFVLWCWWRFRGKKKDLDNDDLGMLQDYGRGMAFRKVEAEKQTNV